MIHDASTNATTAADNKSESKMDASASCSELRLLLDPTKWEEAWLKMYGGEYAVAADGTIYGRGKTQYPPATPVVAPATPQPTMMKDIRGKKGPDGGRNIGFTNDIAFIVPAGSLGLSVAVFTICALTTIAVLYYRRVTIGAELGGPKASAKRHAALLVGLWLVYIVASILSTEGMI